MIIQKCDLCNKKVSHLDTVILYKNSFDYCKDCEKEAKKIIKEYNREIECENVILDSRLRAKERNIIHRIRLKNRGIVLKESK